MTKTIRTAKTRKGKLVQIDVLVEGSHGWTSYIIDRKGYAVAVFIPR